MKKFIETSQISCEEKMFWFVCVVTIENSNQEDRKREREKKGGK
jgi:hypothetical protein